MLLEGQENKTAAYQTVVCCEEGRSIHQSESIATKIRSVDFRLVVICSELGEPQPDPLPGQSLKHFKSFLLIFINSTFYNRLGSN